MRKLLLFLWVLTLPGWCKEWSHQGSVWKHGNGMSITFPADFQVEEKPGDILDVQGKQGFVHYSVQAMKGEKNFKSWILGQQKAFDQEGLKIKNDSSQKLKSGLLARFMDSERTSEQGILFVIVSVAVSKGQDYMCLQMFYPKEREKDWTPLFQGTINSITHP
ncbi:MAG: hypothetical protein U0931_03095 [Vulcanimicrobiota bacterium]